MRVKKFADWALVLDGDILEGAREAYQEDRIIEAFALLHAFIEWEMTNLYETSQIINGVILHSLRKNFREHKMYLFRSLNKELLKKKLIEHSEYKRFLDWYNIRNRIIHRLVAFSYHPDAFNKVTREEVENGFLEGEALSELLRIRNLDIFPSK